MAAKNVKTYYEYVRNGTEFKSDGWSGGLSFLWKFFTGKQEPWYDACVEHDWAYYKGGTEEDRKKADLELRRSIEATGHPIWGFFIYWAVRIFGSSHWPNALKWGFRYNWYTDYGYREVDDKKEINFRKYR